jgi:hypothetical protein
MTRSMTQRRASIAADFAQRRSSLAAGGDPDAFTMVNGKLVAKKIEFFGTKLKHLKVAASGAPCNDATVVFVLSHCSQIEEFTCTRYFACGRDQLDRFRTGFRQFRSFVDSQARGFLIYVYFFLLFQHIVNCLSRSKS